MAGHSVPIGQGAQLGPACVTHRLCLRAAGRVGASASWHGARRQHHTARTAAGLRRKPGHSRQQGPGLGMGRCLEKRLRRALLNNAALVDHRHLVAQVVHHRQIVADEQVGDAELLCQVLHQVEYLGLHRHI